MWGWRVRGSDGQEVGGQGAVVRRAEVQSRLRSETLWVTRAGGGRNP